MFKERFFQRTTSPKGIANLQKIDTRQNFFKKNPTASKQSDFLSPLY